MPMEEVTVILSAIDVGLTDKLERTRRKIVETQWTVSGMNKTVRDQVMVGGKWMDTQVKMVTGMKRFRMELLSVMFFMGGLSALFTGLLKPAMDVVGIFDIITMTLQILFLPIALLLLPIFLSILDFFLSLPEEAKVFIGAIVLIAGIVTMLVGAFAAFGLGIQGLAFLFPSLGAILAGGLMPVLIAFAPVILAIIAVVALLYAAWVTNFAGIREFVGEIIEGIKGYFKGFKEFLEGIWDIIVGILTLNWDKIEEGLGKLMGGLKTMWTEGLQKILGAVISFGFRIIEAIWDWIKRIPEFVLEGLSRAKNVFSNFFSSIIDAAKNFASNLVNSIISGIKNLPSLIADILTSLVPAPIRGLLEMVGKAIPKFQYGGIVTRPTLAYVGERPEAIIPLGTLAKTSTTIYSNPEFNLTAVIREEVDLNEVNDVLMRKWEEYFRTMMR